MTPKAASSPGRSFRDPLGEVNPDSWGLEESEWPQTPEEIDTWLRWFETREPVMSDAEQALFDAALDASKAQQKALVQKQWQEQEKLF